MDTSSDQIKNILDAIWNRNQIWRYILVYGKKQMLSIGFYSPFQRLYSEYNVTSNNITVFKKTIDNVYKYGIKIIFPSLKSTFTEDGVCGGLECDVMETFIKSLNATATFVPLNVPVQELYSTAQKYIMQNKADIIFIRMYVLDQPYIHSTFAFAHSNVYALIPRSRHFIISLLSIIFIFDQWVWFWISALALIFNGVVMFLKYISPKYSLRILLLSRSLYTIIFCSIFQCMIITALTSPKTEKSINNIKDLCASKLNIYGDKEWKFLFHRDIIPLYQPLDFVDIEKAIRHLKLNNAFLVNDMWLDMFLRQTTYKGEPYSKHYYTMKEAIGTGLLTYFSRRNSPYRDIIYKLMLIRNRAGLNLDFGNWKIPFEENFHPKTLSLVHMQGIFIGLISGWTLSILIFIIEKIGITFLDI
ncbi:hypothetical protein GWI33_007814 [Rhynchophorus ferrugineus]|uniref:Uncharacterized protein n=1 Tax=Rhynchophorus ferrugineus TaxID=354439 RepID=A0A834IJM0_RHYFE|nr:hypothetical protein GWI33_007814 [Rhynchophorus ferrugineus]